MNASGKERYEKERLRPGEAYMVQSERHDGESGAYGPFDTLFEAMGIFIHDSRRPDISSVELRKVVREGKEYVGYEAPLRTWPEMAT